MIDTSIFQPEKLFSFKWFKSYALIAFGTFLVEGFKSLSEKVDDK